MDRAFLIPQFLFLHIQQYPLQLYHQLRNILDSIESSRNTTIEKFIVGLNIPLIGGRAAKDIARYEEIRTRESGMLYPFETFIKDAASDFNFTCIEGLGTERNISIHRYFKENYDYVIALAEQFIFSKLIMIKYLLKTIHCPERNFVSLGSYIFLLTGMNLWRIQNQKEGKLCPELQRQLII